MKKGFTLIELLAVIVILAIVLLIAIPLIGNVIEGAKQSAFKSSTRGILGAANLNYANNTLNNKDKEVTYYYNDGIETSDPENYSLEYNGQKPLFGTISVNSEGQVAMTLYNGVYCAEKYYEDNEIEVSKKTKVGCVTQTGVPGEFALEEPVITPSTTDATYDPVTISIAFQDISGATKSYRIDNGEWLPYIGPISITSNSNVYARIEKKALSQESNKRIGNIIPVGWLAIKTPQDLRNIPSNSTSNYILIDNVDLTTYPTWAPIVGFGGKLDGNGYKITGLKITGSVAYAGLFGTIAGNDSEIKNLTIENANISGSYISGILSATITGTNVKIDNVIITGTLSGSYIVGAISGSGNPTITNSGVDVIITASSYGIGGMIGNGSPVITNSYSKGTITATGHNIGGLVGSGGPTITMSYSKSNIIGSYYVGGIIGQQVTSGSIDKCYTSGSTSSTLGGVSYSYLGGIVGATNRPITNSYSLGDITAPNNSNKGIGGIAGVLTTGGNLSNVYSISRLNGAVLGTLVGPIVGDKTTATITNAYWIEEITGITSGNFGTKISTDALGKNASSYPGFNFTTTWEIVENTTSPYIKGLQIDPKNY